MSEIHLHENKFYKEMLPKWKAWSILYEGDHDKLIDPRFLWLHDYEANDKGTGVKSEGNKIRKIREERSRYLNLEEPAVSRWCSFLFRGNWTIPESIKEIIDDEMMKDIDGKGNSFKSFIKDQVGKNLVLLGRVITIVDTPRVNASTQADAKREGLRPYVSNIDPLQVPDWSLSADPKLYGKPQFVRTQYEREKPRADETQEPETEIVSISYKIENGIYHQLIYVQEKSVDAGSEPNWKLTDKVPFAKCLEIPVTIFDSQSFVKDASEMQLLLFNYMSAESSCINAQAFRMVFITGENDGEDRVMTLNEYAFNLLADGSQVTVVEPSSTSTIESAIMRCIDWFFKVAFNQVDGLSATSKESPSADTRRQMKDEFIALVEDTIGDVENIIDSIVRHVAMLRGLEPPKEKITIDKTVTDADYEQELQVWQAFADQFKQIPTLHKNMLKKQAARLNLADEQTIEKEIESANLQQSDNTQQERSTLLSNIAKGADGNA